MIEAFHFLRPWWLLGIIPAIALAWFWIKSTQGNNGWQQAMDSQLLEALIDDTSGATQRWLARGLMAALVVGCVGLAGPTWEKLPQNVEQRNDALVVLLDLSLSMLAEDVKPSRIERARQKVTDVLRLRDEGLTALIAYAGDAHSVVPLTDDVGTIENLLPALGPEMMPVPGSNPDHALELAAELFANSGLLQGRILMITDGIDSINSVTRHRNAAFPVSVIGIGTTSGGTIPLDRLRQPGKVLLTQEGNQVIAMLDHQRLQEVAQLSYGLYEPAVLGDSDLLRVLSTRLPGEDETLDVEREFDTWFDQGHWLALLLVPLALGAFRRGVLISAPLICGLALSSVVAATLLGYATKTHAAPPGPAASELPANQDWWDALWLNDNQRGRAAMRYGQPEKAATLFNDPQWRAAARYRSGDYAMALNEFQLDTSTTGTYNQGNALARLGEYEQAIAAYEQVLNVDPGHADATFNKELLERLLEEQQQAAEEQNQDQQDQANNENSDQQQDQQDQNQDQSDQQNESDDGEEREQESEQQAQQQQQEGEQQQAQVEEDQAERDERQEALEQWLRRVPDDPGGLLKRKFTHETKQRLRRGEYDNRQGEKIW